MQKKLLIFLSLMLLWKMDVVVAESKKETPIVGRKAAERYLRNSKPADAASAATYERGAERSTDDVLFLSLGSMLNSVAYQWSGVTKTDDPGRLSYGVTYFFGEWSKFDVAFRADFNEYRLLDHQRALKLSLLPLFLFPQVHKRFPLYFGLGVGPGVYFQQVNRESPLAFDYQLLVGARFSEVFDRFGFFLELAMKNHLNIGSEGQFNGTALTAGTVFHF